MNNRNILEHLLFGVYRAGNTSCQLHYIAQLPSNSGVAYNYADGVNTNTNNMGSYVLRLCIM